MFEEIFNNFLACPSKNSVKIDFDLKKRVLCFSMPIFSSKNGFPEAVRNYVESRKGVTFKPHATSFVLEEEKVFLAQEVPFQLKFQETLRLQIDRFIEMSRVCSSMLREMAMEETYKNALNLDTHFQE